MREKILKLKEEGRSQIEISKILNCSKSTVSYYINGLSEEKRLEKNRKLREWKKKVGYKSSNKFQEKLHSRIRHFCKRSNSGRDMKKSITFDTKELIKKFGMAFKCPLSGREINLENFETYEFDHLLPVSKDGDNSIDNLQILSKEINQMKGGLTNEQLINNCIEILENQGFQIKR